MEASKEDIVELLNVQVQELEGMSNSAIDHHSNKDGHGRLQKNLAATNEVEPTSVNLYIGPQEGSSELTISQNYLLKKDGRGRPRKQLESSSKQQTKGLKKKGRGRPRKLIELPKENAASLSNLDPLQQLGSSSGQVTHPFSPAQDRKKKKDGRGRPLKQKEATEKEATASMTLRSGEQERQFKALNSEYSRKNNQTLKKDGRGRPRKQKEKTNDEDPAASMNMHLQEIKQLS